MAEVGPATNSQDAMVSTKNKTVPPVADGTSVFRFEALPPELQNMVYEAAFRDYNEASMRYQASAWLTIPFMTLSRRTRSDAAGVYAKLAGKNGILVQSCRFSSLLRVAPLSFLKGLRRLCIIMTDVYPEYPVVTEVTDLFRFKCCIARPDVEITWLIADVQLDSEYLRWDRFGENVISHYGGESWGEHRFRYELGLYNRLFSSVNARALSACFCGPDPVIKRIDLYGKKVLVVDTRWTLWISKHDLLAGLDDWDMWLNIDGIPWEDTILADLGFRDYSDLWIGFSETMDAEEVIEVPPMGLGVDTLDTKILELKSARVKKSIAEAAEETEHNGNDVVERGRQRNLENRRRERERLQQAGDAQQEVGA